MPRDLATVEPSEHALDLTEKTGKPASIVDESTEHFLSTPTGPITARHNLGYQLTSAGIDRDGASEAWLLPADPDNSARMLRDALYDMTGCCVGVGDTRNGPDWKDEHVHVTLITSNDGKAREYARLLGIGVKALDLLEIQSLDVAEVAGAKAQDAYRKLRSPVLVDDTGLAPRP